MKVYFCGMDMKKIEQIITGVKAGNSKAIDAMVEQYQNILFNLLLRFTGDRHEAEDLLQETFMKIVSNIDSYTHKDRFQSWICRIATNLACDYVRKKKTRTITYIDSNASNLPSSQNKDPYQTMVAKEMNVHLQQALLELAPEQRQVFLLREESGVSFREIAHMLEIPLNTALGRMHYAVKKLKSRLERMC